MGIRWQIFSVSGRPGPLLPDLALSSFSRIVSRGERVEAKLPWGPAVVDPITGVTVQGELPFPEWQEWLMPRKHQIVGIASNGETVLWGGVIDRLWVSPGDGIKMQLAPWECQLERTRQIGSDSSSTGDVTAVFGYVTGLENMAVRDFGTQLVTTPAGRQVSHTVSPKDDLWSSQVADQLCARWDLEWTIRQTIDPRTGTLSTVPVVAQRIGRDLDPRTGLPYLEVIATDWSEYAGYGPGEYASRVQVLLATQGDERVERFAVDADAVANMLQSDFSSQAGSGILTPEGAQTAADNLLATKSQGRSTLTVKLTEPTILDGVTPLQFAEMLQPGDTIQLHLMAHKKEYKSVRKRVLGMRHNLGERSGEIVSTELYFLGDGDD